MDDTAAQTETTTTPNGSRPHTAGLPPEVSQILTELAEIRLGLQANQAALGIVVGINVMVLLAVIVSTRKLLSVP